MIEMIMGIILFGLVGGLIHGMLTSVRRANDWQVQMARVNSTLRTAMSILEPSLRELNAGDAAGSDIISMTSIAMTYKASRNLSFLCRPPDVGTSGIWVDPETSIGQAGFAALDSLFLFREGDPYTRADDRWLHASVVSSSTGTSCPGGTPSTFLIIGGLTAGQLDSVYTGAPVRGFEVVEVALHAEDGDRWLGSRRFAGGTWTSRERLAGPMAIGGLEFVYFDESGSTVSNPSEVARVGLFVRGQTLHAVSTGLSNRALRTADLNSDITLRNNPRY